MKFRAKITDIAYIRLFANLVNSVQKFSRLLVFRLAKNKLVIILNERGSGGGAGHKDKDIHTQTMAGEGVTICGASGNASGWCEIPAQPYFSEFNMEGISVLEDEIYLEIEADVLASALSALKISQIATGLKLKLTKKHKAPCLTVEIDLHGTLNCIHDIPVNVIKRKNWPDYSLPETPRFNISLGMPELKYLRLTLERMKNISGKLTVKMSKTRTMILKGETYVVQSTVTFTDLSLFSTDDGDDERPLTPVLHDTGDFSVEVELRSILRLLPAEGVKPTSMICSMADSRLLHILIAFGDIHLQFFVPGSAAV